jgi:hypothetical protein
LKRPEIFRESLAHWAEVLRAEAHIYFSFLPSLTKLPPHPPVVCGHLQSSPDFHLTIARAKILKKKE